MFKKIFLWAVISLAAIAAVLFALLFVKSPGVTPPVRGADQQPLPGSIAVYEQLKLGGLKQWVLMRGYDAQKPVLLILHGGPGSTEMALVRKYNSELEKHFIVVNWDQRGAGKSYLDGLTKEQMKMSAFVSDARELVEYLCKRFGKDKIYIEGHSWGSALGAQLVQQIPHRVKAFVGIGQVTNMQENEKLAYNAVLAVAEQKQDKKALQELRELGPPPYETLEKLSVEKTWVVKLGGMMHAMNPAVLMGAVLGAPEYTIEDKMVKYKKGRIFTISCVCDELMKVDLFASAPVWKVPVYIMAGRHDLMVVGSQAEKYFHFLQAPAKKFYWFENSAHMCSYEEPDKYMDIMVNTVLKENEKH